MSPERYSWEDDPQVGQWGGGDHEDPYAALRPSFGVPESQDEPTSHGYSTPDLSGGTPEAPPPTANPAYGGGAATTPAPQAAPTQPAGVPGGNYQAWFTDLTSGKAPNPQTLHALEPQLNAYGIKVLRNARGWADKIQLPDGSSYDVITAATATGGKGWAWQPDAPTVDGMARNLTSQLTADGHQVKSDGLNALIVDGRRYLVQPNRPTWQSSFEGKTPYTPTAITNDDLEGLGYKDVATRLGTPVAGATEKLMLDLLAHPESLDDQMVATLKAQSADELADIARADEQDLTRYGVANNFLDSNWLASERRAGQYARDRALVDSNRNIDITAAQTRLEDRRKAAGLGTQYQAEERSREALATDVGLRQAAETKDRFALNESLKQKAAELQMDVDALKLDYTRALMDDITRRWGIEVQAEVDWARLAMQSQQFQDELIFKMHELDQRMTYEYDRLQFDYISDEKNRDQRERLAGK